MLRSIFILMLAALMASVGLYYENQAGGGQTAPEFGIDHTLAAATAIRRAAVPVRGEPELPEAIDSNASLGNSVVEPELLGVRLPFSRSVYPAFCVLDGTAMIDE